MRSPYISNTSESSPSRTLNEGFAASCPQAHTVSSRRCGSRRPDREYINTNQNSAAARCEPTRFPEVPLAEDAEATPDPERPNARETRVETAWLRERRDQAITDVLLMRFSDDRLAAMARLKRGKRR